MARAHRLTDDLDRFIRIITLRTKHCVHVNIVLPVHRDVRGRKRSVIHKVHAGSRDLIPGLGRR
jgi:hypothetical protein